MLSILPVRVTDYEPPPGRPGWSCPKSEELDLLYLAWGWRKYRETPMAVGTRNGWLYFLPWKGAATLVLPNRRVRVGIGELIVLHPDCECGFDAAPRTVLEVCTWVWRSASRWPDLRPPAGGYFKYRLPRDIAQKIRGMHEQTRREIQSSDEHTRVALELARQLIDLTLVRSQSDRPHPATDSQRLELACRWIEEHLENHTPLAGLSDYLQLSASTLNRVFQRRLGLNVRAFAKQARLRRARQLVHSEGASLKEAAFSLGYRFPNDLSRAFSSERPKIGPKV